MKYNGYKFLGSVSSGTITCGGANFAATTIGLATTSTMVMQRNATVKNKIKCPECGSKMYDTYPNLVLTSCPAQKQVHCDCGFSGYQHI